MQLLQNTLHSARKKLEEDHKKHYNNNCFRELFCNNFGQDGIFVDCFSCRYLVELGPRQLGLPVRNVRARSIGTHDQVIHNIFQTTNHASTLCNS